MTPRHSEKWHSAERHSQEWHSEKLHLPECTHIYHIIPESKLVSARRSTVLSLPLQQGFHVSRPACGGAGSSPTARGRGWPPSSRRASCRKWPDSPPSRRRRKRRVRCSRWTRKSRTGSRCRRYKLFFLGHLYSGKMRYSVCPWQVSAAYTQVEHSPRKLDFDKHSSLF